jgi:hypothetical protein
MIRRHSKPIAIKPLNSRQIVIFDGIEKLFANLQVFLVELSNLFDFQIAFRKRLLVGLGQVLGDRVVVDARRALADEAVQRFQRRATLVSRSVAEMTLK